MPERTSHARSRRDAKRDRILVAATAAFAAQGFHGTRVSDVARRAGVADGTIYLYFANKNELLETIFSSAMDRFMAAGAADVFRDDDPAGQLRRVVEEHLGMMGKDRELASVFQVDLRHSQHFLGEVSRRVLRPYLDLLEDIVRRGQAAHQFALELDPPQAALMVFGVLDQLTTDWVLSRRNYRLKGMAPAAADFVLRAVGHRAVDNGGD